MIELNLSAMRQIFPNASQVKKQETRAGINANRNRLAYFFANIEHECGGFTIRNLTENLNYTAERMLGDHWPGLPQPHSSTLVHSTKNYEIRTTLFNDPCAPGILEGYEGIALDLVDILVRGHSRSPFDSGHQGD